jgi:hypothetical protein
MQKEQIHTKLETLYNQKRVLKYQMDKAITDGKNFEEVKAIHLRIKELTKSIDRLEKETSIITPYNFSKSTQAQA